MWLWVALITHFSQCTIKFIPIPTPDNYTANPAKNIFFSHFPLLEFTTLDTTLVSLLTLYVIWATKTHLRGLPRFCKSSNPLSYNYTVMLSNLWGWALCQLASKTHEAGLELKTLQKHDKSSNPLSYLFCTGLPVCIKGLMLSIMAADI